MTRRTFFSELTGLARGLENAAESNKILPRNPDGSIKWDDHKSLSSASLDDRLAKQAAKLARRAARAAKSQK